MTFPTYDLATEHAYQRERITAAFLDRARSRALTERRRRRPTHTISITRRLRAV